jgi:hypothetical protein
MSQNRNQSQPQRKALPEVNEEGLTFGEFDTDKKYPFPATWMGKVVVTQYNVINGSNGYIGVDEGTRRTMPYDPAVFAKLVKDQGFNEMQYFILHDPR